ncbi:GRAS family protein RAD1-like [Gastrolobium bilobum]|uniref:GRAS family protein RAD1-like n=1 Tax=Gastrolobium bilobum TaxID=150636 RepID=UPI002AB3051D|nr:GRAS family protein RAD1-like [Gastrolobium bilobum]
MEDLNSWLSFYMNESANHEHAIRRFCPARMEQDQREECQDQEAVINEIELCSSDSTSTPCLASSEVDDFVDSFINMDQYKYENEDQESLEKHQSFDHFVVNDEDGIDTFSMVNDAYGHVPINMEDKELEMSGSFGAIPDLVHSVEEADLGMDQGLDLVHMLLACAEAVACRDTQRAHLLLNEIWALASPCGDSLQRVSYCFATGLKCRLSLFPHNVFANDTHTISVMDVPLITREQKLEAFHVLCQTTPYLAFGFMAANEAILQSSHGKSSIHIIDLGMEHILQWPSLLRGLVSRPEGPPKLRITGLISSEDDTKLKTSMNVLVEEASSLGIPLEIVVISEPAIPTLLTKEKLNLREGEALFVNSILHLHKYVKESRGCLKAILQSIKKLGPVALTVVEQDTNHNGPFFLGRFLESLQYYSAIFDSLEESMPRNSQNRMKIECVHFAEEIRNIVAYEGSDRMERHERLDKWRRKLGQAGFQVMPLKCTSKARKMLSVYDCKGYTLTSEKGCLQLGWKGRPIMMASAWKVVRL